MSKPKLIDIRRDLFVEKVWKAYKVFGSCRKAASVLGISYQTVRRILKAGGYKLKAPGGYHLKGKKVPPFHYGCLASWLRANPGVRLPRSPLEVSKITGCSLNSVKSYVYRRRRTERKASRSVGIS